MNVTDAKRVLIACRPGSDDLRSAEASAALDLVQRDAELRRWWEEQQAFHKAVRDGFSAMPAPAHLRDAIVARRKIIAIPWWRQRVVWSAAAALFVLAAAVGLWQRPMPREDSFVTFRSRVVRSVLRQYRMDITTNDMTQIRQYLASRAAPADYTLPSSLARLPAMGAGVLSWQDRKVSMVCLDAGREGTMFLFIVEQNALREPPAGQEFAAIKNLNTVSWSEGGKTYVLAGAAEKSRLEQLL